MTTKRMSRICRLCLKKEENILKDNIFDLRLTDTFYWIYGVEVDVDDPFSKLICKRCQNITNYIVRVRKQFQTNQYILKEKRCPLDYDVDFSSITKDVGTSTENNGSTGKIVISLDTLGKLSQPLVKVRKLEETDIHREYRRISRYTFRKRRVIQTRKGTSKENDEPDQACLSNKAVSLPVVILPRIDIKAEPTEIDDEIQSVNSTDAATNTASTNYPIAEARSRPVLISRATNTNGKNQASTNVTDTDANCENTTLLSTNILKQLFSPIINVQKLEDTNLSGQYEKVDEITYRLKPPELEPQTQIDEGETKRLSYMDYYYKIPTSALKELIIERHNELSGDQNSIAINNCKEKEVSLFKLNDVPHVEICKQCQQTFKTNEMLKIHCLLRHKKPKTISKRGSKPRKRKSRYSFGNKPKKSKNRKMEFKPNQHQVADSILPTINKETTNWLRPRKISDLFSSFEQSKFSNKELWLDETITEDQSIANIKKSVPTTETRRDRVNSPKAQSNHRELITANSNADQETQDAPKKNPLRLVRRMDRNFKSIKSNASRNSAKELPIEKREISCMKSLLFVDPPDITSSITTDQLECNGEISKSSLLQISGPIKSSARKTASNVSSPFRAAPIKTYPARSQSANKKIHSHITSEYPAALGQSVNEQILSGNHNTPEHSPLLSISANKQISRGTINTSQYSSASSQLTSSGRSNSSEYSPVLSQSTNKQILSSSHNTSEYSSASSQLANEQIPSGSTNAPKFSSALGQSANAQMSSSRNKTSECSPVLILFANTLIPSSSTPKYPVLSHSANKKTPSGIHNTPGYSPALSLSANNQIPCSSQNTSMHPPVLIQSVNNQISSGSSNTSKYSLALSQSANKQISSVRRNTSECSSALSQFTNKLTSSDSNTPKYSIALNQSANQQISRYRNIIPKYSPAVSANKQIRGGGTTTLKLIQSANKSIPSNSNNSSKYPPTSSQTANKQLLGGSNNTSEYSALLNQSANQQIPSVSNNNATYSHVLTRSANKQIPSSSNNSSGNSAKASEFTTGQRKIMLTNKGFKYLSVSKPQRATGVHSRNHPKKACIPPPSINEDIISIDSDSEKSSPSTSSSNVRQKIKYTSKSRQPSKSHVGMADCLDKNHTVAAPKLAHIPEPISSSNVQPEIVWFPEIMEDSRDLFVTEEADKVITSCSDDESSDPSESEHVMTSTLNLSSMPVEDATTQFIVQRLCDIKQTRAELKTLQNIRKALHEEIETAQVVDKKYDFIMNILTK